jgi:type II secretory pathway component PulF
MLVKQYTIKYIDTLNRELRASIVALSIDDALSKLSIAKTNFISASIEYKLNRGIPINSQLQILTRVAGGVLSGETVNQYLPSILDDFRVLKNNKALVLAEINKGKTLSELLSYLDINQLCVKIISNGERSGNLANSIKDAQHFLKLENKTQNATSKTLQSQLLILLLAFGLIFGFPSFVVDFYQQVTDNGMTIDHNLSTDILFFLNAFSIYGMVILTAIIIVIALQLKLFLKSFGGIYPISIFQSIITTKSAILFLSIFTPLFKTGMQTQQILSAYSTISHANANKLEKQITDGVSIADAVQNLTFSNTFKSGFKGFNRITNTQAKLDMLAELFSALVSDLETYNQQASLLIKIIANTLIYSILLILVHGFVLPQLSMGAAI